MECVNKCKVEVNITVWENAELISCPRGSKFKKKATKQLIKLIRFNFYISNNKTKEHKKIKEKKGKIKDE